MSIISINNLIKSYQNKEILHSISLSTVDNEFIVIVGPSGCGKTTLLRCIAGLEEFESGNISVDGKRIDCLQAKDRNISMVFQNYSLFPNMNVFDNMAFPLKMRKIEKKTIQKRVMKVADDLEITELLKRKPNTLSGGQKQRVAIGRAIIHEPKVFLFDEPFSSLDASLKEKLREELMEIHSHLPAVFLLVTHDQKDAMTMGDRIIVLKDGEIQQFDTPQNIYLEPRNKFVAQFIGSPKINFISASLFLQSCPEANNYDVNYDDIDIAIRPEFIELKNINVGNIVGKISFVEFLGKDVNIIIGFEKETITVSVPYKVASQYNLKTGSVIGISIKYENVLFFNKKDGKIMYIKNEVL